MNITQIRNATQLIIMVHGNLATLIKLLALSEGKRMQMNATIHSTV